jgi:hypothetical protein
VHIAVTFQVAGGEWDGSPSSRRDGDKMNASLIDGRQRDAVYPIRSNDAVHAREFASSSDELRDSFVDRTTEPSLGRDFRRGCFT